MEPIRQINAQPCPVPVERETTVFAWVEVYAVAPVRGQIQDLHTVRGGNRQAFSIATECNPIGFYIPCAEFAARTNIPELDCLRYDCCEHLPVRTEHSLLAGERLCESGPIRHVGLRCDSPQCEFPVRAE